MFTLRISPKMTKSEKPPAPGVALSFGEIMEKIDYWIDWQGNVSFWARLCNYNCSQGSIKLTGLSMTTFVGYVDFQIVGRIIVGFAVSLSVSAETVYISEIAPAVSIVMQLCVSPPYYKYVTV